MENKCGYSKRNWAVPVPIYESHEQLVAYFAEQARRDCDRQHYTQNRCIADLWEDDRCKLLTLPEHGFEAFRLGAAVVNKYGEIRIDDLTVPLLGMATPGSEVLIQTFWDRLVHSKRPTPANSGSTQTLYGTKCRHSVVTSMRWMAEKTT